MDSFEPLSPDAKRVAAARVLPQTTELAFSFLGDDTLVESAESVFLRLDLAEATHA
jgi:hypothetical protein